jgi:hypothetical protein
MVEAVVVAEEVDQLPVLLGSHGLPVTAQTPAEGLDAVEKAVGHLGPDPDHLPVRCRICGRDAPVRRVGYGNVEPGTREHPIRQFAESGRDPTETVVVGDLAAELV